MRHLLSLALKHNVLPCRTPVSYELEVCETSIHNSAQTTPVLDSRTRKRRIIISTTNFTKPSAIWVSNITYKHYKHFWTVSSFEISKWKKCLISKTLRRLFQINYDLMTLRCSNVASWSRESGIIELCKKTSRCPLVKCSFKFATRACQARFRADGKCFNFISISICSIRLASISFI